MNNKNNEHVHNIENAEDGDLIFINDKLFIYYKGEVIEARKVVEKVRVILDKLTKTVSQVMKQVMEEVAKNIESLEMGE